MAQKFFDMMLRQRKPSFLKQKTGLYNFKPLKPSRDIADFEYPQKSRFYTNASDSGLND